MKNDYTRYAVVWSPRSGSPLAWFGKKWTGWCADSGTFAEPEDLGSLPADRLKYLGDVAKTGLLAQIHPPFVLTQSRSAWWLIDAMQELARSLPVSTLPKLMVTISDDRVVLTPERSHGVIAETMERVATLVGSIEEGAAGGGIDISIPAPPLPRSQPAGAFEIPLTSVMAPSAARDLADRLREPIARDLEMPPVLEDLALLGDPGEGRPWRLIERYPLASDPIRTATKEPRGMSCPGLRPMPPLNAVLGSNWDTVIA